MKRLNFKSILMALSVTLAFLLLVGVEQGNAQGFQNGLFTPPAGPFVNSDQAQTMLFDQFVIDKTELQYQAQGSPIFKAQYRKVLYYVAIREQLLNGQTVPNAIVKGLEVVASDMNAYGPSPKQLQAMKDDAVAFLKS